MDKDVISYLDKASKWYSSQNRDVVHRIIQQYMTLDTLSDKLLILVITKCSPQKLKRNRVEQVQKYRDKRVH